MSDSLAEMGSLVMCKSHWKNMSDTYVKNNNRGASAVAPSDPKIIYVGTGNAALRQP